MTAEPPRFVADEMLGKLARELRALGYDTLYLKHVEDADVLEVARREDRYLLTRDQELAQRAGPQGHLVRSRDPDEQLGRLITDLEMEPRGDAFLSRCLECNGVLVEAPDAADAPEDLEGQVTWRCPGCKRLYWWGSHAEDMYDRLGALLDAVPEARPEPERKR